MALNRFKNKVTPITSAPQPPKPAQPPKDNATVQTPQTSASNPTHDAAAAFGMKVVKEGVRNFLERAANEFQQMQARAGRNVIIAASGDKEVAMFEAGVKALYDAAGRGL